MENQKVEIHKKYFIIIGIFFVAYCLFLSWSFLFQNVDDAYISFRYGKNLMIGNGLVFNKGEYVEGYTNFLWTIITSPFTVIKTIDVSVFALSFGIIISVLNIFFLQKITRLFSNDFQEIPRYFLLLPVIFYALDDTIAFWAIGGMEFPLYILLILLVVYFYLRINDNSRNVYWLSIALMFCTLSRPEGNMIFAIVFIHFILNYKKINNFRNKLFLIIGLYGVFFLLYYSFKYFYYGNVLPNTFYAKGVTDLSMNIILGTKYVIMCVGIRIYVLLLIFLIPFKRALRSFKLSFLILFAGIYLVYIVAVGGDWMYANRFFVPIIPILYLLSAIGITYLFSKTIQYIKDKNYRITNSKRMFSYVIIGLCITLFIVTITRLEYKRLILDADNPNNVDNAKFERQWSRFGQWLKLNCDSRTVIAVGPAGKIPFYSELYSVDMWGLNDVYIARTKSKRSQAGHKKFDFKYVLQFKPEFIIGGAESFDLNDMPAEYEKFNPDDPYYQCYDFVFRLKKEYRTLNK